MLASNKYSFFGLQNISRNINNISPHPLKSQFYTVKLGFTGVYINFPISAKNRLCKLVRTATSAHNVCFEQKYENYQNFSSESFHFFFFLFGGKILNILG